MGVDVGVDVKSMNVCYSHGDVFLSSGTILFKVCCWDSKFFSEWKIIHDPTRAAVLFRQRLLEQHEKEKKLKFTMDMRGSVVDREKAIICFYKSHGANWASPLHCVLEGRM